MTSKQVKDAFATAGVRVRVADQRNKFRICTTSGEPHDIATSLAVAASLGMTDCLGRPGGSFEGYVMWSYKPNTIIRI